MIIDSHVHICPHEMHAKAIRDWFERNAWFEICYGDEAPKSVIRSIPPSPLGGGFFREMLMIMIKNRNVFSDISGIEFLTKFLILYPISEQEIIS